MPSVLDLVIIVPAYNEEPRIAATVNALQKVFPAALIIVCDDGSLDNTAGIAESVGATVLRSEQTIGKGGAANLAVDYLVKQKIKPAYALLCDGDLGESAGRLASLVNAVESGQCDLAVASFKRRVGGGFGVAVGFAHWAIKRLTGLDLSAPISGQRALTQAAFAAVTPFAPKFQMEIAMTVDAVRDGHRLKEIELDLGHRATGRSFRGFLHRARQLKDFIRVYLKKLRSS